MAGLLAAAAIAAVIAVLVAGDGGTGRGAGSLAEASGAGHVHGLGVDPKDGSLLIATHNGLFRVDEGATQAAPVGEEQDVMGFTVAGSDRFLASGHPGPGQELPPNLGLVASTDGGRTFRPVSLLGEADFHVLRSAENRVYGFDSTNARFLASRDGGRSWDEQQIPAAMIDLAVDPSAPDRLVASMETGLYASADGGRTWRALGQGLGLLAWAAPGRLFSIDAQGGIGVSHDGGRTFSSRGSVNGQPVAFMADGRDLYAALADGRVVHSVDDGRSWRVRVEL